MKHYRVEVLHGAWSSSGGNLTAARTLESAAKDVEDQLNRIKQEGYNLVTILASGGLALPLGVFESFS